MITIDGSFGEGGGQILRTSLALSLVTGEAFRIERIRAGRKKPGLRRQHLTAVNAAKAVGRAEVAGAAMGSMALTFAPGPATPGEYHFAVGTAGSATLVLQTVLPALLIASGPSTLTLEGGTHNPYAPPFDFLRRAFLPLINRMGPNVQARIHRHGFFPAGGGRFEVAIAPAEHLLPIELLERGEIRRRRVRGVVSRLPLSIAEREVRAARKQMSWPEDSVSTEEVDSAGPGNVVMIEIESEHVVEVFTGFGRRGVRAEAVAAGAAREALRYLAAGAPAGEHLADQLLVPMAMAGGGAFRTLALSTHSTTNIEILKHFLDVEISEEEQAPDVRLIRIHGAPAKRRE